MTREEIVAMRARNAIQPPYAANIYGVVYGVAVLTKEELDAAQNPGALMDVLTAEHEAYAKANPYRYADGQPFETSIHGRLAPGWIERQEEVRLEWIAERADEKRRIALARAGPDPARVAELRERRAEARQCKDYATADAIRAELKALGVREEDQATINP